MIMQHNDFKRYLVAILAVVLVSAIKLVVPGLGSEAPSLLYLFAIFLVANFLGFYPAILATLLSAISINYLFAQPQYGFTLDTTAITRSLTILVEGLLLAWLLEKARKLNRNLTKMNENLTGYMEEILKKDFEANPRRIK